MPAINGRQSPSHASLTGVGVNDHHNQVHAINGVADHTWPTPLYKATDYTVLTTDLGNVIRCDSTSGNITMTLPPAASCTGRRLTFKRTVAGAFSVTVDADSAELIDGATTKALATINACLVIYSRGATWEIESLYLT